MDFEIVDLGQISYSQCLLKQKEIWLRVANKEIFASLILCQHYPVITLGRNAKRENIIKDRAQIIEKGIEIIDTDRGGDVTFHGDGQLVMYPILNLNNFNRDIHGFIRKLEEVVINYLKSIHLNAKKIAGLTGVWIENKKIASIGIAVRRWTSYHGVALNVYRESINNFALIRPCGMDIEVTSIQNFDSSIKMGKVKSEIINTFKEILFH